MERYKYSKSQLDILKKSSLPFAIYQFIDNHVVTLALSSGFLELFGLTDYESACNIMDNDMYRDCHPDDIADLQNAAVQFATDQSPYDIVYRLKVLDGYKLIHAVGKHIYKDNVKLAIINYTDEGSYL